MSQGLFGGVLWGVLAAGFGLVVVSQVAPPPKGATPAGAAAAVVAPVVVADAGPTAQAAAVADVPSPAAPVLARTPPVPAPSSPEVPAAVAVTPEPVATGLPQVADARPVAVAPGAQPVLKKPAPLPPTPPLVAKEPVPATARLPGMTPDPAPVPDLPDLAAAPVPDATVPAAAALPAALPVALAPAGQAARPPKVETASPAAMAALPDVAGRPTLASVSRAPAAASLPAAVAMALPAPVAPSVTTQVSAPTVVVTDAPRAILPADAAGGGDGAPALAATARGGFQPGLIGPQLAPPATGAADAPPVAGALPPPPPLTPEEMAVLAGAGEGPADPALPEVIVLTEAADPAAPSILKKPAPLSPVPSLVAKGQVPAAERLPRSAPVPAPDAAAEPVVTLPDDAPPIDRFARPFDNAAGKPVFAIVLIDTGDPQVDRAALAEMPFPVTFALDPSVPESALAASIYRAAGQEVVMLATGIPAGATAADVEVSFGAHEAALPETVAVLDTEAGGFQGDRPLASLVVPVLKGQGRGLLSWDRGLNAASQVARREGLRSGVIFRRLDGEGEPVAQIRRYLDRAAFKAAQDGRVIVAGENVPDTVKALLEWAVEGRASSVALVPLTAALRVE